MTPSISPRDEEVLRFIIDFTQEVGYPPTVREIGYQLDIPSPSSVQARLVALIDAGYLERAATHSPRALRVLRLPETQSPTGDARV